MCPLIYSVADRRLHAAPKIGVKVGKIIDTYKMAKHLDVAITDTTLALTRKTEQIAAEARLDGIYVLRTSVPAGATRAGDVPLRPYDPPRTAA